MPKALIASVGGTPEPVVTAIREHQPDLVCFMASQDSVDLVADIRRRADTQIRHHRVMVEEPENLVSCYRAACDCLEYVKAQGFPTDDILVDYTGGTKPMSAALALATVPEGCPLYYVGGTERNKGGLGQVLTGHDVVVSQDSPWDLLAHLYHAQAAALFNRSQYAAAVDVMSAARQRAKTAYLVEYLELAQAAMSFFQAWDCFDHPRATSRLHERKSLERLSSFAKARESAAVNALAQDVRSGAEFVHRMMTPDRPTRDHVIDLLANAARRAHEGKFDDAVARLYRALEMAAQVRLKEAHGIPSGSVPPDKIPESLRQEYIARYGKDGTLKLPLEACYRLLAALGDELGAAYESRREELRGLLGTRNRSILAHGSDPVSGDTYEKLRAMAFEFVGVTDDDLPQFPVWPETIA